MTTSDDSKARALALVHQEFSQDLLMLVLRLTQKAQRADCGAASVVATFAGVMVGIGESHAAVARELAGAGRTGAEKADSVAAVDELFRVISAHHRKIGGEAKAEADKAHPL